MRSEIDEFITFLCDDILKGVERRTYNTRFISALIVQVQNVDNIGTIQANEWTHEYIEEWKKQIETQVQ